MKNSWRIRIYLLTLISLFVGTSEFVLVGVLDKVADDVGVTVAVAGQLITIFAFANAIGTPLVILATSKLDQRKQLILALVFTVLGSLMTVLLPGFTLLMFSRIVLALGMGIFIVTASSFATKIAPPGHQASALATVAMGFSASLVLGVPIGRFISASYDWKIIFWAIALIGLVAIFAIVKLIPVTKGEVPVPIKKQLSILKNPKITALFLVTFFVFVGYGVFYTYVTPFLNIISPMSNTALSLTLLGFGLATLIGSRLGGSMSDRLGSNSTLFIGMTINLLALILLATIAGPYTITILLLLIWGTAAWTSGPTLQYSLVQLAPKASVIILSLSSSFLQLGMATGSGIGGIATSNLEIQSINWIGATAILIGIIILAISLKLPLFNNIHSDRTSTNN
ncbi:MFS transporter [Terribacillus sp. AE2B 122]|uniref:MFS transporter n=1 Tax=Terribacillus sp. AE2B 122 TaxID=1331902 RepID=UPI0014408510|nr:MFS transporter [Terribacillus sp. AE2B 122]VVM34475.1 Chloramphenicol resistance protein [Terribacillus sp. AE2B 122]